MEEIAVTIMAVSAIIGFPMVVVSYLKWRHTAKSSTLPLDAAARIEARVERIEQAIDTVALETERIAEGQRWLTKMLADQAASREALPRGQSALPFDIPPR